MIPKILWFALIREQPQPNVERIPEQKNKLIE